MADANVGRMKQGRFTLSATPGTVSKISLPSGAGGFRIRPQGAVGSVVIFAVGEDPAAEGAGAFATGNIAVTGEAAEVRIPGIYDTTGSGAGRDLRLRSTVASLEVIVETF